MARIRREEVAFPSSRDPRFGGNMARATEGAQYAGASRDFYGGPSRGSPMLDQRYENYQAPHRVDYTSPRQTGTPNFIEPMQGKSTYPHELQHQGMPRQHPNPRMRHINPRGMGGGLGGLQETTDLWQDIHPYTWNRMMHGPEFQGTTTPYGYNQPDEYGRMRPTLPNPYEGATIGGGWDDDYRTLEELKRANPGWWDQQIEPEGIMEALPDEDQTAGLWQDWKRIFERTGNAELADFWISSQQAV